MGTVLAALDEVRYGAANILNLRESRPTVADALARTESWLRERQVARAGEVLVITGRGNGSVDGVAVVRAAVERLCGQLRRRGVVATVREHSPGALLVTLAPVTALVDAPSRARHAAKQPVADPVSLAGLTPVTRAALRGLAERSLDDLGARVGNAAAVEDEMLRLFARLSPSAPAEPALCALIVTAHEELDAR
jgi:hypothetical protein